MAEVASVPTKDILSIRTGSLGQSETKPEPNDSASGSHSGSEAASSSTPTMAPDTAAVDSSTCLAPPPPSSSAPASPRRLNRKRAASIDTEEANRPHNNEDLNIKTSTAGSSSFSPRLTDGPQDLICLCTPAPKVPRPRNAFILYRQHHQAGVVAQNPGLANPEISKIIGEQWREEPEENKNQWKRLAEEEKQRHQRQYPDYRYQPRRGGKSVSARPTSAAGEDPGNCPKCGGRYIATPRTPSTPFVTSTAAVPPVPGPYMSPNNGRQMSRDAMTRPNDKRRLSNAMHVGGLTSGRQDSLQSISEEYDPMSPSNVKRRRHEAGRNYHMGMMAPQYLPNGTMVHRRAPSVGALGGLQYHVQSPGGYAAVDGPLPGPAELARAGSLGGPMAPPPRPSVSYHQPTRRRESFDESLRLPPLQTQVQASPLARPGNGVVASTSVTRPTDENLRESQARSIESMVMSIPYLNKLKVLGKISPPLVPPGPSSPAVETRGPVMAIEGNNQEVLQKLAVVVQEALSSHPDFCVRTWWSGGVDGGATEPLKEAAKVNTAGSASVGSSGSSKAGPSNSNDPDRSPFSTYLDTIQAWHVRSAEIVRFVTTRPEADSTSNNVDAASEPTVSGSTEDSGAGTKSTGSSRPVTVAPRPQAMHRAHRIPIALITGGFSLTISDRFASAVPIADSYAPVDHWQWMATLWRGIVGPDLVICVRGAQDVGGEPASSQLQAVELVAPGVMVVRLGDQAELQEKTVRRLSFEVVEWVRAGSYTEGF